MKAQIIQDSLALRLVRKCAGCGKRRLTTPTNVGSLCNECLCWDGAR